MADRMDEIQRTGPVAAARSEAAWLRGDHPAGAGHRRPDARRGGAPGRPAAAGGARGAAATLGQPVDDVPTDLPFALQARGRWREAAEAWGRAGSRTTARPRWPRATSRRRCSRRWPCSTAWRAPLARIVRARLRELGVAGVPRGPRPDTRDDAAGLTARQREVLALLARTGRTRRSRGGW